MTSTKDKSQLQPISYSINGGSAATGFSRSALYKAMKDGRLPFRKYGKRTMLLHKDLQAFVEKELDKQPAELGW